MIAEKGNELIFSKHNIPCESGIVENFNACSPYWETFTKRFTDASALLVLHYFLPDSLVIDKT